MDLRVKRVAAHCFGIAAGWVCFACHTPPLVHREDVLVRADYGTEEFIPVTIELARIYAPKVAEALGVREPESLEIWLRTQLGSDLGGYCLDDRIAVKVAPTMNFTLAHELAHLAARGTEWSKLPYVLREGVADLAAAHCVPAAARDLFAFFETLLPEALPRADQWLDLDFRRWTRLTLEERHMAVAWGWHVASTHTLDGLRQLMQQHPTTAALREALRG